MTDDPKVYTFERFKTAGGRITPEEFDAIVNGSADTIAKEDDRQDTDAETTPDKCQRCGNMDIVEKAKFCGECGYPAKYMTCRRLGIILKDDPLYDPKTETLTSEEPMDDADKALQENHADRIPFTADRWLLRHKSPTEKEQAGNDEPTEPPAVDSKAQTQTADCKPALRTHQITLKVNDEELQEIDDKARTLAMTLGAFCRMASLGIKPKTVIPAQTIKDISRWSANLNQLAAAYNSIGKIDMMKIEALRNDAIKLMQIIKAGKGEE